MEYKKNIQLSIIIPFYNTTKYLKRLLDLLEKQVNEQIEIIVINDGSTEDISMIKDYKIKLIDNKLNRGVSAARNEGLNVASGQYVTFMDSDDTITEEYIEEVLKALEDKKDYYYISWIDAGDNTKYIIEDEPISWNCAVWCRIFSKEMIGSARFDINKRIDEENFFLKQMNFNKYNKKGNILKIIYKYNTHERKDSLCASMRKKDREKLLEQEEVDKKIKLPIIKFVDETLEKIINEKCSIARFGDGEFRIIEGGLIGFQEYNEELANALKQVVASEEKNLLIGIPNLDYEYYNMYNEKAKGFWINYLKLRRSNIIKLLKDDKIYYSSQITRFYLDYENKSHCKKHLEKIRSIWENRDVVMVEGEMSRVGVGNDLFDNVKTLKRILCPAENAFNKYKEILNEIVEVNKNNLILIALGPTATVLAYDLCKLGYQAIDLGHLDIEYEWFLRGAKERIKIPNKYINEIAQREIQEIDDDKYKSEIINQIKG